MFDIILQDDFIFTNISLDLPEWIGPFISMKASAIRNCLEHIGYSILPSLSVDRTSALYLAPEVQLACSHSTGCRNSWCSVSGSNRSRSSSKSESVSCNSTKMLPTRSRNKLISKAKVHLSCSAVNRNSRWSGAGNAPAPTSCAKK